MVVVVGVVSHDLVAFVVTVQGDNVGTKRIHEKENRKQDTIMLILRGTTVNRTKYC